MKPRVFIEYIKSLGLNNNIKDFEYTIDITTYLSKQFAGLVQKMLSNQKQGISNLLNSDFLKDLKQLGIVDTISKLSGTKFAPVQCMEEISFSLSFMGIFGSKWVKDREKFERFLKIISARNGTVRFLMINPYSNAFSTLKNMREKNINDTTTEIFLELVDKYHCLQAKYYDFLPSFRLIFIDNKMVVMSRYGLDEKNYFKTDKGWNAPHLVIERDYNYLSLFDPFQSYYNWVWDNAIDVKYIKDN